MHSPKMTAERKFFLAIRHKPSGGFLPSLNSYGFTRAEPTRDQPPRLFTKHGAALQALNSWLEGEWFETPEDAVLRVRPVAGRRREEMEIVEIELIVRTLEAAKLRLL